MTDDAVNEVFKTFDGDGNGVIDHEEFMQWYEKEEE